MGGFSMNRVLGTIKKRSTFGGGGGGGGGMFCALLENLSAEPS
jgi:hypothetical protein